MLKILKIYKHINFLLLAILFFLSISNLKAQVIKSIGLPIDFDAASEYEPAISNNGDKLAFISNISGKSKLYLSKYIDGQWSEPAAVDIINDFAGGQASIRYPAFNYDGSILYFSADYYKDSSGVDIFYSVNIAGDWTEPQSIGAPINTLGYEGQASISADDKYLYFTRKAPNPDYKDIDCRNIYVSVKDLSTGKWQKPKKLPVPVNVGCEQAPRILLDNKTLYFSSVREGGKGGFDIYRTKLLVKNVWLPAESLDTLNSEFDDYAPTLAFNSNLAYFSIKKVKKKQTSSKIYTGNSPANFLPDNVVLLKGNILDLSSKKALDAKINIYDPITARLKYKFRNANQKGVYEIFLPQGDDYQIDFYKENFSHFFYNADFTRLSKNMEMTKDVKLFTKVKLLLNIFDNEIYSPVNAKIEIKDNSGVPVNTNFEKIGRGRYLIELPIGTDYSMNISAPFFEPYDFHFNLNEIVQFDEFERDVELEAKKVDFEINVTDEITQAGIPVEVVITNLDNNEVIRTTATKDANGKYRIKLREGDRYNVSVSPKGYSFYNTTVDLKKKDAPKKLDVKLKELKEDTKLTLNNITFESNSADLNESSYTELDRVVKLMNDNPGIRIEISAHTDNVGSDAYNMRLSKRRAQSVVQYLLDTGIDQSRLISRGYGESKPLVPNDTDEHKAMNRRVELKIVKVDNN